MFTPNTHYGHTVPVYGMLSMFCLLAHDCLCVHFSNYVIFIVHGKICTGPYMYNCACTYIYIIQVQK